MQLSVHWDAELGAATISHDSVHLDGTLALEQWRSALLEGLERVRHTSQLQQFPVLVCIDGFSVVPALADSYGSIAKQVTGEFASALARYGEPALVRPIIAVEGMKHNFQANLFESQAQALAHVHQHKPNT